MDKVHHFLSFALLPSLLSFNKIFLAFLSHLNVEIDDSNGGKPKGDGGAEDGIPGDGGLTNIALLLYINHSFLYCSKKCKFHIIHAK